MNKNQKRDKRPKKEKESKKPKNSNKPKLNYTKSQELTSEQWAKWNEDYFGTDNFEWPSEDNSESWEFLDPDLGDDPGELNFDHGR